MKGGGADGLVGSPAAAAHSVEESVNRSVWHAMEVADVLKELRVDPARGLPASEVERRLAEHGANELTQEEGASPVALFFGQFKNVLIIILIVATVLSAVVGEYVDAAIILVIILFCAVLGFVQEYRAERALDALKSMLTPDDHRAARRERAGDPVAGAGAGRHPGAGSGRQDPADARIVENHSLQCDEAPLTGESVPVIEGARAASREDAPVGDRRNMVFTGTTVTYGRGKAVVTCDRHAHRVRPDRAGGRRRGAGEDAARAPHRGDRQMAGTRSRSGSACWWWA